jgi:hypothetical protein
MSGRGSVQDGAGEADSPGRDEAEYRMRLPAADGHADGLKFLYDGIVG